MTAEEYAAAQAAITAAVAAYVVSFSRFFIQPALSLRDWVGLLQLLFPEVSRRRTESAELARVFYDAQRFEMFPGIPRQDVLLEAYDLPSFIQQMDPARKSMSQAVSPANAMTSMVLQTTREVENGGRRQIINAVEADNDLFEQVAEQAAQPPPAPKPSGSRWVDGDPGEVSDLAAQILRDIEQDVRATLGDPVKVAELVPERPAEARLVRGWARVATGNETCGWCLMLISRGPTYMDSRQAGMTVPGWRAEPMIAAGEDVSDYMKQWHIGCDCKVIPVYDLENWSGKTAADRAMQMYKDAYEDADAWRELYPDRVHLTGKNKGEPFTKNEDIVLALRRRLEAGVISTQEYSALSAVA